MGNLCMQKGRNFIGQCCFDFASHNYLASPAKFMIFTKEHIAVVLMQSVLSIYHRYIHAFAQTMHHLINR